MWPTVIDLCVCILIINRVVISACKKIVWLKVTSEPLYTYTIHVLRLFKLIPHGGRLAELA